MKTIKSIIHFLKCHYGYHEFTNNVPVCIWCRYNTHALSGGKFRKKLWLSDFKKSVHNAE